MIGIERQPAGSVRRHGRALVGGPRTISLAPGLWQPAALIGLCLLLGVALMAVFAGILAPGDPLRPAGRPLLPPSAGHPLGTDDLGRDLLAMVLHGSRTSLLVGLAVTLLSGLLGTLVGAVAGYCGRRVDDALMRLKSFVEDGERD